MKIIKCDKCGKEQEMETVLDQINRVKFSCNGSVRNPLEFNKEYDLCDDCYSCLLDITNNFMKK